MRCERCNEQEARVFTTHCVCSSDPDEESTTTTRSLCEECNEIENPGAAAQLAAHLERGCRYCGKKVGVSICDPCVHELRRFMQRKGFSFHGKKKKTAEEAAQLMIMMQEIQDHMKQWVSEGGPDRAD